MNEYSHLGSAYADKDAGYYAEERRELLPFVPKGIRAMLDVGCSSGGFASLVKQDRPEVSVWGIEPDAASAAAAAERIDRVINSTLDAAIGEIGEIRFDLICFNDVLEHLADPESALRAVRGLLSPEGRVLASIPNILFWPVISEILVSQDFRYVPSGVLDKTHLRFFTKKSIVRLFDEAGFEVTDITGINPTRTLFYVGLNLLLLNRIRDWRYIQFAVTARPKPV